MFRLFFFVLAAASISLAAGSAAKKDKGLRPQPGCPLGLAILGKMGFDAKELSGLLTSIYAVDVQELENVAAWSRTGDGKTFFKFLAEELLSFTSEKRFSIVAEPEQREANRVLTRHVLQRSPVVLSEEVKAELSEWMRATGLPRAGKAPSRREVIHRIHNLGRVGLTQKEMDTLFHYLIDSGLVAYDKPLDKRAWPMAIRDLQKSEYLEGFFQRALYAIDQGALSVLPLSESSRHLPGSSYLIGFIRSIMDGGSEVQTYRTQENIRETLKEGTLVRRLLDFGLKAYPPHIRAIFFRVAPQVFGGSPIAEPNKVALAESFEAYVKSEAGNILLQFAHENGLLQPEPASSAEVSPAIVTESEPAVPSIDEPSSASQDSAVDLPSIVDTVGIDALPSELLASAQSYEIAIGSSGILPAEYFYQGDTRSLQEAQLPVVPQDGKPSNVTGQTRVKIKKPKKKGRPADGFGAPEFALDLTWNGARNLFDRLTVSRPHFVRVMGAFTQLQTKLSEDYFERELQSVCYYLQELEKQERFTPQQMNRHVKKLTLPHLWEIKPQGRSETRVIFSVTSSGIFILDVLVGSKNNENALYRRLSQLSEEARAIRASLNEQG